MLPSSEPSLWVKITAENASPFPKFGLRDSVDSPNCRLANVERKRRFSVAGRRDACFCFHNISVLFLDLFLFCVQQEVYMRFRLACLPIRRNCLASVSAYHHSGVLRTGRFTGRSLAVATNLGNSSIRGFTESLRFRSDNMGVDDAFREMEAAGVPKQGQPTAAAAPQQEQQKELPKLSTAEFRVYNRMAEHMDLFVRLRGPHAADLLS